MVDIEELRKSLKQWRKEKIIEICKEYNIPIDDELKQKTKREIEHMIISRAEELNKQEEDNPVPVEEENQLQIEETENTNTTSDDLIGKLFKRVDDETNNPNVFKCERKEHNGFLFSFNGGTIVIDEDSINELLVPYEKNNKVKETPQEQENQNKQETTTLVIEVPHTINKEKSNDTPKVIKIDTSKKKNEKSKTETKNSKPIVGAGRGRLTAKIQCFDSPERKTPIKEFNTFADARVFLNVKSVGNSLERASETGKPSRGYWWIVSDIGFENTPKEVTVTPVQKEDNVIPMEIPKNDEQPQQHEDIIITPPVLEKKAKKDKSDEVEIENFFDDIFNA